MLGPPPGRVQDPPEGHCCSGGVHPRLFREILRRVEAQMKGLALVSTCHCESRVSGRGNLPVHHPRRDCFGAAAPRNDAQGGAMTRRVGRS